MVELQLNGAWTDITDRVYLRDRIQITRGRQDQGSRVDPGSCTLTLNNKAGRFSPRNPMSPYYGLIGRGTPVRVSAVGGDAYLDHQPGATYRVSTPSTTALQITGDLDARWDVEASNWDSITGVVELGGKWGAPSQKAWHAYIFAGSLWIVWTTDGTTELVAGASLSAVAHPRRMCLRVTMDVSNGAGGRNIAFYTGASLNGPWTQLGSTQTFAGTTATASSTAGVEIGDNANVANTHQAGRIYAAQIRSGIGGTIVAAPDFTTQTPGALSFTDSAGVPWTASSTSALTNKRIRFAGEISAWPSRWDVSGGDVYVPVQAAGIMRRLGQGASPLDSTLRRRIPSDPSVVAYWPMEDGQDATAAYSPIPGVQPMVTAGLEFAADNSLPGSAALPTVGTGASIRAVVPTSSTGAWRIEFVYKIPTTPSGDANLQFLTFTTAAGYTWRVGIGAADVHLDVTASDGSSLLSSAIIPTNFFSGSWSRFYVQASQSSGNVAYDIGWYTVGGNLTHITGSFAGSASRVTAITTSFPSGLNGISIGHVAVFSALDVAIFNGADTGFAEEDAADRYVRLCSEEGIPATLPYGSAGTAPVGPQRPGTVLDLLEEAADADVGILYEARESIALAYRPRTSLYNQVPTLALDYATRGEVAPPLEPTEDDTATRNDITVSRPSGSSARAVLDTGPLSVQAPPNGVGRYPTSQTLNVQSDTQLPDLAGWLLHLGTTDEPRYPSVTVNLAAGPWLAGDACAADVGDLITISNLPVWLPPGDIAAMIQGYTEIIGVYDWTITYNCTPGSPWTVGILEDTVLGRADTDGSELAADIAADDTTLSVAVTAGPLWTTDPAQYPFDLRVGGEVVTATACSGSSSPQSFTVTRAVNGIARGWDAGTDVRLANPMTLAL
jgi:hypothetical protein